MFKQVFRVIVPQIREFVARAHFVVDTSDEAALKINSLGRHFMEHYLPLIETDWTAMEYLTGSELMEDASSPQIITARGETRVRMSLGQFYGVFIKKPDKLLTNGQAVIAHVPDVNRKIQAVRGRLYSGGWNFESRPLDYPEDWFVGSQVLYR